MNKFDKAIEDLTEVQNSIDEHDLHNGIVIASNHARVVIRRFEDKRLINQFERMVTFDRNTMPNKRLLKFIHAIEVVKRAIRDKKEAKNNHLLKIGNYVFTLIFFALIFIISNNYPSIKLYLQPYQYWILFGHLFLSLTYHFTNGFNFNRLTERQYQLLLVVFGAVLGTILLDWIKSLF